MVFVVVVVSCLESRYSGPVSPQELKILHLWRGQAVDKIKVGSSPSLPSDWILTLPSSRRAKK